MNPLAKTGAIIVVCALASYSVAVLAEQRRRLVTAPVLLFLTLGVMLDVTATAFMIAGSSKGPFTLHGLLGYSSLAGMIIDAGLIWRFRLNNPATAQVSRGLHLYTRAVYGWWIAAFVTGGLLVAMR
jgi:hypothetical protein